MGDLSPVPAVTRDQVFQAIDRAYVDHPQDTTGVFDAMTDAVMALLAEAPQPKVLWEGETLGVHGPIGEYGISRHVPHSSQLPGLSVPAGTRVAVVALGPPVPEAPEGGSDAG